MTNPFALPDTTPAAPAAAPVTATAPSPVTTPAPAPPAADPFGAADPFDAPAPQQARGPRIRDLYGRLLLLVPRKLEENVPNRLQLGTTQDRLTADVIVLDGGPIAFGGRPENVPPVPHDKVAQVPHKTASQYISNRGLISQCREALAKRAQGQPGMVLGRLTVGTAKEEGQNAPYLLTPPTDADKALARQYLAQVDPFA
jgi:hypothetical protein